MDKLKICKDCKHFSDNTEIKRMFDSIPYIIIPDYCWCNNTKNFEINLVNGDSVRLNSPQTMRSGEIGCGKVGMWFEQKDDNAK